MFTPSRRWWRADRCSLGSSAKPGIDFRDEYTPESTVKTSDLRRIVIGFMLFLLAGWNSLAERPGSLNVKLGRIKRVVGGEIKTGGIECSRGQGNLFD